MSSEVLVRAPNWIGDQILAYPFFYYLRKAFPRAKITSVCVPWVKDIQFLDLVDEVVVLPVPLTRKFLDKLGAIHEGARKLKEKKKWDLGISLPNSFSAAWLMYRAGVQTRRGYRADGRSVLLNDGVDWNPDPSRHRAQAYVDLLPTSFRPAQDIREFWGVEPENKLDSRIPGELEIFPAEKSWGHVPPVEPPAGPYWVLAPGATAESRRWPLERFAQLVNRIHDETGMTAVVVGGPTEAPLVDRLRKDYHASVKDFTARGPVSGLWRLFRGARFTVCNESGLSHVAALCGSPVHIVCGAANPTRTQPIGPGKVEITVNPVECWPCEKNLCFQVGEKKLQCLKGIHPDAVWEEIEKSFVSET